jgi:hypothetical protein
MTKSITILIIVLLATACKTKKETNQWNLNEGVGWKSENPNDYTVLWIKWNQPTTNSVQIRFKKKFDETVLKELKSNALGDQAANDFST